MDVLYPLLVVFGPFAVFITKLTDLIRNTVDKTGTKPKWLWNVVPFVIGVVGALLTGLNLISQIHGLDPAVVAGLAGVWGKVATGLCAGAIASLWHEVLDNWSAGANAKNAVAMKGNASQT